MDDIITFYDNANNGDTRSMFCYVHKDKFIIKGLRNEYSDIAFCYWTDFDNKKTLLEHVKDYYALPGLKERSFSSLVNSKNNLGKYYPRIYRKGLDQYNDKEVIFFRNYDATTLNQSIISCNILLKKLNQIFETISFNEANFNVFGHEIRNVLLLACMEVESAWNGILKANEYPTIKNKTTNDYVKLCKPLYLNQYEVSFRLYPNIEPINPYQNWNISNPTKSLFWYDAYNQTKHDREGAANLASLQSAVYSVSAAIVMLYAQFGPIQTIWNHSEFLDINLNCPKHSLNDYYIPNSNPPIQGIHTWEKTNFQF